MKTSWNLNEKSTGHLKVTVSGDVWQKAQEKAFKKLAKEVQVAGFRKGQAPENLVRKQVGGQKILIEAVDYVANEAYTLGLKEQELVPIASPTLDVEKFTTEEATLVFHVTVNPEVTLGEYKGLEVDRQYVTVDDEEVLERLQKMQDEHAELVIKEDGEVVLGDTAVIDFEGFKDGVAFEGGKGENHPLEIGSNTFIPGFEEQLIGLRKDDEKEIDVTFPQDYGSPDLAGQAVTFKVKIQDIKSRVVPQLNDDFAKDVNAEGVDTLEQLKEKLHHDIEHEKQHQADEAFDNSLISQVVEGATVEIPDVLVEEETNAMFEDFKRRLQQQGFSLEMYTQITGQDETFLKEQISKDAENKVKVRLVLHAVAKKEDLNASEEEIEHEFTHIASTYNMEIEKVKEMISGDAIAYDLKLKKAFELIKESAQ